MEESFYWLDDYPMIAEKNELENMGNWNLSFKLILITKMSWEE